MAAPKGGHLSSSGKRRLIRGGGLVSRISNDYEPQFPVVREDLPCLAARDVVTSHVDAVRPLGSGSRRSRVIWNSFQFTCSDSDESDDDVLSAGAVRPLPNAAPLGGAGMVDVRQRHADVEDDVFFMRTRGPMDRPGTCCARFDDFDWVVPPYVPDLVLAGRDGAVGATDVGREVCEVPVALPALAEGTARRPVFWSVEPQVDCVSDKLLSERELVKITDVSRDIRCSPDAVPVMLTSTTK